MATILNVVENSVEQLFSAVSLSVQGGVLTAVYNAIDHVVHGQIRTAVVSDKINRHVAQFLESGRADKALGERFLRTDEFLAPIDPFVQAHTIASITDQRCVKVFGFSSMATSAKNDTAVAADANLLHKETARKSPKRSNQESYKGHK